MKTKLFFIGLLVFLLVGCSSRRFLPKARDVGTNQYGGYIKLFLSSSDEISGELISVEHGNVIVLEEYTASHKFLKTIETVGDSVSNSHKPEIIVIHDCEIIPYSSVKKFRLRYMHSKYNLAIPLATALAATSGWAMIATLLINDIITINMAVKSGKYSNKDLTYDELKMFARFPQGIPPEIDVNLIK
jgi:hypothetical protein